VDHRAVEQLRALTKPVKLVIWDLDDTFWSGTLSEGPVTEVDGHAEIVRTLNRRGIINAICSKNDHDAVIAQLGAFGLLEEFVFIRADWTAKGQRVARIISDAQLRAENVLFLDDHPQNRQEAAFISPGLQTAGPELVATLLDQPEVAGKDDPGLTRLAQDRILERKLEDKDRSDGDNEEFLRSCDIRVRVVTDPLPEAERLHELLLRTNQMNFTKRRPTMEEFTELLQDPSVESGYVEVADRYGDYGICGFFSLRPEEGHLVDFLFSCRILNMGVEQWLFDRLGQPELDVVGEVVSSVPGDRSVDWITEVTTTSSPRPAPASSPGPSGATRRILMVGGCDLNTTADFLGGTIDTDFSHPGETGAFIFTGHTETIRQSAAGLTDAQMALVDRIPFLDRDVFQSKVITTSYDVLVLSVLTDYTQGLYRHRETGLVVPWLQFHVDVTDPAERPRLVKRHSREAMDEGFFEWFADEFEFLGGLGLDRFKENLAWLVDEVGGDASIIFLNGAEVALDNPKEPNRHLHHARMNGALEEMVAEADNATICDIRQLVTSPDDLTDHLRHYRRQIYLGIAEQIRATGIAPVVVRPETAWQKAYKASYRFAGRRKLDWERWQKRRRQAAGR